MSDAMQSTRNRLGGAAAAALALLLVGAFMNPAQASRSYLFAYTAVAGLALGALSILLLTQLTGGGWGLVLRRILEAAALTLPLLALLFLPIIFGLGHLYVWARPEAAQDPIIAAKAPYLNAGAYVVRAMLYFAVWCALALAARRASLRQDADTGGKAGATLRTLAGPGLALYALAATFAAFDWTMSLEPHWYSTVYGVLVASANAMAAMAFAIVTLYALRDRPPLAAFLNTRHVNDLGNLLLTFVMFWTYIAFTQFLIIWSADLPEETPWYLVRTRGAWAWVPIVLVLFHFFLPFFLLLFRRIKRDLRTLAGVSVLMLVMRLLDNHWLVVPAFSPERWHVHWMDLAALAGLACLWLAAFLWALGRAPLLPAAAFDAGLPPTDTRAETQPQRSEAAS